MKNRFQRGSGCYKCGRCGKQTRETGEGEGDCGMCLRCFNMSMWENGISDGHITVAQFVEEFGEQPDQWCHEEGE